MKYRLMDLLACPYDKHFPLELYVIETEKYEEREIRLRRKPACELYCAYHGKRVETLSGDPGCEDCLKNEVKTGVLYCVECGRWFPIIDEIPYMLPDDLRKKQQDLEFLKEYSDKLPEKIVREGKPWALKD